MIIGQDGERARSLEVMDRPSSTTGTMISMRSMESLNSVDTGTMAMAMSPGASQLLQEIQSLRYTIQRNESELSKNQFALSDARAMSDDLRVCPSTLLLRLSRLY